MKRKPAPKRRPRGRPIIPLPPGCSRELARALLKGDPDVCHAMSVASQAINRGVNIGLLGYVTRLGEIVHDFAIGDGPPFSRDARTGQYVGPLVLVLEELRPYVPPYDDAELDVVLGAIWQVMHGAPAPPEPGGMRAVKKAPA